MSEHTYAVQITESQQQVLLLALAILANQRPGWVPACIEPLVKQFPGDPMPMYEAFRTYNPQPKVSYREQAPA